MNESTTGLLTDPALRRAVDRLASAADDPEILAARVAWSALAEPGEGVTGRLVTACGPVAALQLVEDLAAGVPVPDIPGVTARDLQTALKRWLPRLDARMIAGLAEAGARARLTVLTPEGRIWSERFDDLGEHAPLALWVRGDPEALGGLGRSASLVGARAATPYGEHVSGMLAGELAAQGVAIVSGGAYGVDGAAHRAALGVEGRTVAFVAGGADRVYPAAHAHLFARIAEHGAVIAEVPPGGTPTKWRFLQRNRLIAAVSAATVVVEAGWRSGSLNTAGHAAALGRPLGAVPGSVTSATSEGCHRLMREFDATCVTRAADVLELIGEWDAPAEHRGEDRPRPEAIRVLDALGLRVWRTLDDIARRAGMSLAEVQAELGLLELDGRVESSIDGWRIVRAT
ncbi:DNA-processing protein DprA [Microbacterium rhizophilus]|uniref:DNA-processing protein DprA n=1 Tax=Microbacterium rhizophilus TaxID=3138934 RepID=UPI0031EF05AD